MSFEALKKNRDNLIKKNAKAAENLNSKKSYQDDRFWQPNVDKTGTGFAVIRFLPNPDPDGIGWTRYWEKAFQGPTGFWYIEKCLTTINQPDPVVEMVNQLFESGREEDKNLGRQRKRKERFVSNIYVVNDPSNPDNEGKVFLFKYGKRIFDKIDGAMHPKFEDEEAFDPFDFWGGANFRMKIRRVDGQRNYDMSVFDSPSPLFDGDEDKLKEVYDNLYSLDEFTDPSTFKSYDELKQRLTRVLGEEEGDNRIASAEIQQGPIAAEEEEIPMEFPSSNKKKGNTSNNEGDELDEEEDMDDFFKTLAEEN